MKTVRDEASFVQLTLVARSNIVFHVLCHTGPVEFSCHSVEGLVSTQMRRNLSIVMVVSDLSAQVVRLGDIRYADASIVISRLDV